MEVSISGKYSYHFFVNYDVYTIFDMTETESEGKMMGYGAFLGFIAV